MAQDRITKKDICKNFLVTEMYGEKAWNWPRETIAACKIICTDKDEDSEEESVSHQVYMNDASEHAEVKLIKDLPKNSLDASAKKIRIMVYQNYSPCSECADKICDYIDSTKGKAEITIAFANFYRTHAYKTKNNNETQKIQDKANVNIDGLKKLQGKNGVTLELLGAHVEWDTFLDMSEFFSFAENEKKGCLDKAGSKGRKDREEVDKKFWEDKILVQEDKEVEDVTSALAQLSTIQSN